jgi:hypothetical protein
MNVGIATFSQEISDLVKGFERFSRGTIFFERGVTASSTGHVRKVGNNGILTTFVQIGCKVIIQLFEAVGGNDLHQEKKKENNSEDIYIHTYIWRIGWMVYFFMVAVQCSGWIL